MIIYYTFACCGNDFRECRELRKGESVLIKDEDKFCDECRRDDRKCTDDAYDKMADNDEWMNYYSNDNMNY